jgi:hypothetical protein
VTARLRDYMAVHPSTGGYGIPLRYARQAAQAALRLAEGGEVVVLGPETRPMLTETPTIFNALLFGTPHRFADVNSTLPFPERDRIVYLVGPVAGAELEVENALLERLGAYPSVSPGPEVRLADGVSYRTLLWSNPDRTELLEGMTVWPAGVPFANNVVLAAYEAEPEVRAGESLVVWLAWWLRAETGRADYHFTVQLLDGGGRLVSQDDQAGFPSELWRAGDLVLSRFSLVLAEDLPSGIYELWAGNYTYPDIEVVPVISVLGEPIDAGVNLSEVRVLD